jgi:uncharacterized LabA/DUF88 family protein
MEILLIDAENFQVSENILDEIIKNHSIRIKNIYADFSEDQIIRFWNSKILKFGLNQIQTLKIRGKGSVDATLMLDALELSLNHNLNKVIICGNDKDYIPLCKKLREYDIETHVYGYGYSSISHFCDSFVDVSKLKLKEENKKIEKGIFNKYEVSSETSETSEQSESSESVIYIDTYTDESDDSKSNEKENELELIKNLILKYFKKNKKIRIGKLKQNIRKNKNLLYLCKKNLCFNKLDKSLIKAFPDTFIYYNSKNGCMIKLL